MYTCHTLRYLFLLKILTLAELEVLSRFGLSVLLSFHHACISCQEMMFTHRLSKVLIELHTGAGHSQPDRLRLTFESPPHHIDLKINHIFHFQHLKWFTDFILNMFLRKIINKGFSVDLDISFALAHEYTCY